MIKNLFILSLFFSSTCFSAELKLETVMNLLSQHKSFESSYKETKIEEFFDVPVYTKGIVSFKAPDFLKKSVGEPSFKTFEIKGGTISIYSKGDDVQRFEAKELPLVNAIFESFRSILSGDKETLNEYFKFQITGDESRWNLKLTPNDNELIYYLDSMVFIGQQGKLIEVTTTMENGDLTHMTFLQN